MIAFIKNFVRFSRLHTIIGTSLSIICLYLIALSEGAENDAHITLLLWTLFGCLAANIYIVGLNQITDIDIDKINKPYLPLASGAFSKKLGIWIVGICLLISIIVASIIGRYLLITVILSLLIGTAYSLPPIRLKRFTFWASFCIIAVRGLIINLLLFLHFHDQLNQQSNIPTSIWVLTGLIFIYSVVIAWFKDIPDMEGDKMFDIETYSLRRGAQNIFRMGNFILLISHLGMIAFAALEFKGGLQSGIIISHVLFILAIIILMYRTNPSHKTSMARYYQFIWILFFAEYLLFGILSIGG